MLYVSTRNKTETFSVQQVLHKNTAPDGGLFVPFQLSPFQGGELLELYSCGFHNACARILNLLFSTKLTGADVEFGAGRHIVTYRPMNRKIIVAETWHNPDGAYSHLENALYSKLTNREENAIPVWVRIAIRIAVLFGIYTHLYSLGVGEFNVTAAADDCVSYLAPYYARQMGLPVGTIVIGCNEKSCLWSLIHKGEISAASTETDAEPLINAAFGYEETIRYLECCKSKRAFVLGDEQLPVLSNSFFASVISKSRLDNIVCSIWCTDHYIITSDTAASYSALQDYRSRMGESRCTLIFADGNPLFAARQIQDATGLSYEQLVKQVAAPKE